MEKVHIFKEKKETHIIDNFMNKIDKRDNIQFLIKSCEMTYSYPFLE